MLHLCVVTHGRCCFRVLHTRPLGLLLCAHEAPNPDPLQGNLQSARAPPVGSRHSCQPTVKLSPYITPSMNVSSGKGVVRGRRGKQLGFALPCAPTTRPTAHHRTRCTVHTSKHVAPRLAAGLVLSNTACHCSGHYHGCVARYDARGHRWYGQALKATLWLVAKSLRHGVRAVSPVGCQSPRCACQGCHICCPKACVMSHTLIRSDINLHGMHFHCYRRARPPRPLVLCPRLDFCMAVLSSWNYHGRYIPGTARLKAPHNSSLA